MDILRHSLVFNPEFPTGRRDATISQAPVDTT